MRYEVAIELAEFAVRAAGKERARSQSQGGVAPIPGLGPEVTAVFGFDLAPPQEAVADHDRHPQGLLDGEIDRGSRVLDLRGRPPQASVIGIKARRAVPRALGWPSARPRAWFGLGEACGVQHAIEASYLGLYQP